MAGPLSGKYGAIDAVKDITNWSITETSEPVESVTSATKGGRRRSSGIKDASGSYAGKGGDPIVKPFVKHAFKGYSAPDDEVYGSAGITYEGDVYANSITINFNPSGNEDINHSVDFAFDQGVVIGSGFYKDDGPPYLSSVCPFKIEYGAAGAEVEIEHISTATLTFTVDILEYVNSSTNCTKGRKPGPLDWSLDITIEDNVRPIPIQADERLKVWINATEFFILEFGHLASYSDFNVDIESGAIISQTMNWMMQAYEQDALTTIGQIIWPDLDVVWPPIEPTVVATVKGKNDPPAVKAPAMK